MTEKPNFILFVTDQHRADYLGCYGHPVLRTPHIDAMAENGICFDKFYVNSPVCMPNRASLMTCRMPTSHDVRFNGIPLARRHVTFVELLKDAGYDTALIGKSHLQNFTGIPPVLKKSQPREGFHHSHGELAEAVRHDLSDPIYKMEEPDFWAGVQPEVKTPFYGFDHVELVTGHGDNVGGDYTKWLLEREPNAADLIGRENQLSHDYICPQAVRTAIPPELYSTQYIAERAMKWLDDHRDSDRPFFLMVSWPDPHHPFNPPGQYWDMYKPGDMEIPEAFKRNDWMPPSYVDNVHASRINNTANIHGMSSIGCSLQEALEARALTCGMIAMIDDAVGSIQSKLVETGNSDQTVSVFTADHGDHLGDHRLLLKGAEQYEQITQVPFIWSDPQGEKGIRIDNIGQTMDVGASILERARVEKAFGMQGQNLIGPNHQRRDHALTQYTHQQNLDGLDFQPNVHSVRDKRFRLSIMQNIPQGELYDLDKDPGEMTNLWNDPGYLEEKVRLLELFVRSEISSGNLAPAPTSRA